MFTHRLAVWDPSLIPIHKDENGRSRSVFKTHGGKNKAHDPELRGKKLKTIDLKSLGWEEGGMGRSITRTLRGEKKKESILAKNREGDVSEAMCRAAKELCQG